MSTDYGEKERQFLETLKGDTGRDVAEWMAAIAAEKLEGRNAIIDWLRRQGFMFSKASWLERIHNNGGKPIYENSGSLRRTARPRSVTTPAAPPAVASTAPPSAPPPAAEPPPAAPRQSATVIPLRIVPKAPPAPSPPPAPPAAAASTPPPPAQQHDLETVLAKAKAFRPLANYVLSEIAKAVPGSATTAGPSYVVLSKGAQTFAVLTISGKELRLGLALKGAAVEAPYQATKLPSLPAGLAASLTHMAVLTDARQINETLIGRVRDAADRVG
jgi:hypothetical protein